MTQDEIIRMAREAGFETKVLNSIDGEEVLCFDPLITDMLKDFVALVAAHVKSDQINTAYQQGCEDMKHRMEKRMQQLESQLQLCQTAVADEREACAKVCDEQFKKYGCVADKCAAAIRARSNK